MSSILKNSSTKFVSELYLFSNKIHLDAENWFKGSVIEHINLKKFDHKQLKVCALLDDCLNHCGREFKHVVRIINFNPKALLLVKISAVFEKALSIHGHESVGDLIKIQRAFTQAYEATRHHAESLRSISSTQRNSSFLNDPLLKAELKQL